MTCNASTESGSCSRRFTGGRSAEEIFGWPDGLTVRSSITLCAHAADDESEFLAVLDELQGGERDQANRGAADLIRRAR